MVNGLKVGLMISLIATLVSGCGSSDDSPAPAARVITEAEFEADLMKVNQKEKALEDFGLRIKRDLNFRNGVSTETYSWNTQFWNQFRVANPDVTEEDVRRALSAYRTEVQDFLKKYAGTFTIRRHNGNIEQYTLRESVRRELTTKAELAENTLET